MVLLFACVGSAHAQYTTVRVNGLALLTGTLNAGVDIMVNPRWSIDGTAAWKPIETNTFRSKAIAFSFGVRYWRFEPHVGPFIGIHSASAIYDVKYTKDYRKGWMSGIGVSYGYSRLLSNRWNITAELGLGCFYMRDKRQEYYTSLYEDLYIYHYRRVVLAPSRAEIGISYLF